MLVDERDAELGLMEKMQAHKEGRLHRAISIFIFNTKNEMLLQKRAAGKYHSPGLWTNACCSHPRSNEHVKMTAIRRLREEMGMSAPLQQKFSFIYKADMKNGLIEHEYDHVFTGITDEQPLPDPSEVADWKYISLKELKADLEKNPSLYTAWFRICFYDYYPQLFDDKL